MKKFLIGFFAVIGFLSFSLFVLMVAVSSHHKVKSLPDKIVLTLPLDQELPETTGKSSMLPFNQPEMTLYETIQTLDRARQDQRVIGLAAKLNNNGMGLASMQELRDAIRRFERSGKFAYVYIDDLGDGSAMKEYWLASGFDQIWLHPVGSLALSGFAVEMPFGRAFLNKLGVEPELHHQGKYKSFPESVMRDHMSAENREVTTSMLHSISDVFYHDVAESRHINESQMNALIDQSLISAPDALSAALVDSIGYRDEFDSYLEQMTKGTEAVAIDDYQANGNRTTPGVKMALINVHGALTTADKNNFTSDIVSAGEISESIHDAADKHAIKAIIVRVDSPGGTPLAADIIRRAIQLARQRKPVIVSMSNTAASGGYWMSVSANAIIAQPTTLTGSIGVFGGKFNASELFDKLGVNWDSVVAEQDNSDLWSISKPYSAASQRKIDAMMASTYQQFIQRVSEGRKMSPKQVEEIAEGRVWTGAQAIKIGLVDQLGGLDTALATAKTLAKIPAQNTVSLDVFPKPLSPIEQLMHLAKGGVPTPFTTSGIHNYLTEMMRTIMQSMMVPQIRL